MKTCIRCSKDYPKTSEHFYYRNKAKGWLSSWCKDCRKEKRLSTRESENQTQRERRSRKRTPCKVCGGDRPSDKKLYCELCHQQLRRNQKREDKALYKSRLRKAKPRWANAFFIQEVYRLARLRTKQTGFDWHVDHIVPIRGAVVCGLHTHENLRVIPGKLNQLKSNRFNDGNHYSLEHGGRR